MLKFLQKHQALIAITLILAFLATFLFAPALIQMISLVMLVTSIGMTIAFIFQRHWLSYQQAEFTREKMTRNLSLDLLGLLFTIGAALYAGRFAGSYFGIRAGMWAGLIAGFAGGFLAAWMVRSVWGKMVRAER